MERIHSYKHYLFDGFILFLLVFSFPIPGLINSIGLAAFLAVIRIAFNPSRINNLKLIFYSKYFLVLISLLIIFAILAYLYPLLLGTNDLEKSYTYLSQLLGLTISTLVVGSMSTFSVGGHNLVKLIIGVFVFQSLLQIITFVFPSAHVLVRYFQFEIDAIRSDYYGGIRGLAISGRLFFELSASYALMIFLYFNHILVRNKPANFKDLTVALLLIIASFFTGRTALLGLLFGFIYFLFVRISLRIKISFLTRFIVVILILLLISNLIMGEEIRSYVTNKLLPWVFELFYSYADHGKFESNSLSSLNDMYNINLTSKNFLVGTGNYTNSDGSYFMNTDSGYLRQFLFWGIGGFMLNVIYTYFLLKPLFLNRNFNNKLFILLLIALLLILQYKGEIIGHSRFVLDILYIYVVQSVINSKVRVNARD